MSKRQTMEQKCWRCMQPIHNEKMRFQEKQYHPRCYYCDVCKVSLKGQICHEERGKLYDQKCWQVLNEDNCARCKTTIKTDMQKFRGKVYHQECFICAFCKQTLAGISFKEDDHLFYHEDCFRSVNAHVCGECRRQINGDDIEYMQFQGKFYHNKCFACLQCRQPITGGKFKIQDGQKYCTRCR